MCEHDEVHGASEHERIRADEAHWNTLTFVGIQDCFGLRGPDEVLELRNCTCGSTLGRRAKMSTLQRGAGDLHVRDALEGVAAPSQSV